MSPAGFPSLRASNVESVSMAWCHNAIWPSQWAPISIQPVPRCTLGTTVNENGIMINGSTAGNSWYAESFWETTKKFCIFYIFSALICHKKLKLSLEDDKRAGACLSIKMLSYQYRDPHVKDKTVSWQLLFWEDIRLIWASFEHILWATVNPAFQGSFY